MTRKILTTTDCHKKHLARRSSGLRKTVTLFVPKSPPFLLLRLAWRYALGVMFELLR
jgi:hypothetical protein